MLRRDQLLLHVQVLGHAFVRRGMRQHASKLRVYYLAVRGGLTGQSNHTLDIHWSSDFVVDWMRTLRLPPFQHDLPLRASHGGCERCPRTSNERPGVHTDLSFPGGARMRCQKCGAVWLE